MKLILAPVLVAAALMTGSAWAQSAADTLKDAATQAATQAATDGINKAAGTTSTESGKAKKDKKEKKDKKDGPNWGKSEDHRRDGDHGHKGKKKDRD